LAITLIVFIPVIPRAISHRAGTSAEKHFASLGGFAFLFPVSAPFAHCVCFGKCVLMILIIEVLWTSATRASFHFSILSSLFGSLTDLLQSHIMAQEYFPSGTILERL